MTTAQNVFYIIGSIALGLAALFMIFAAIVLIMLAKKVNQAAAKYHAIAHELQGMIQSGKSYTRYLGASFMSIIFGGLLRALRRHRHSERY